MVEEEQFVNIDLNDDNICTICKLDTDTGTLSFCHVCFELSIEGVSTAALLHSTSLHGHRDCFEKYHLIANQKVSHAKATRSTYEGVKRALSQQISRIVQYAQNRDSGSKHQLLFHTQQGDRKLTAQSDAQVPRYAPRWVEGTCPSETDDLELLQGSGQLWRNDQKHTLQQQGGGGGGGEQQERHAGHSREKLVKMSVEELHQLNSQLLLQIQEVFEELSVAVQEKDSLASQLHVRHIAIEQLFKNCAKLPWLQIGRAGVKASNPSVE
ncbi:protein EURL homolog [Ictalurus furcatus]|uniref:protein EURL homolog n=1 Tax=Ictalurus furcatus TaxID=66913 RepID=UPI00234FC4DA|nr:protein EURL homolog [Ictalurus furcatus]XP_053501243.1 protein EURL homolog [Ictalurus furcatus]XP_053501244.1 protein EURL homolog [Ictalurus furcatus]